jgi:hypothetical protein
MKSIDAVYRFGNLYNRKTLKRILMEDGAEIAIVLNESDVLTEDPNLKPDEILDSEKKREQIKAFLPNEASGKIWKLFKEKKYLYFQISAGVKRKNGVEPIHFLFKLKLLEDLYIYNKKEDPKYARFWDCHCLVEECLSKFEFFEPLYCTSLNDAYTKTYELYFAMFGKSTANAFDRFYESKDLKEPIRKLTEETQKTHRITI